jgi:hypothetical protein
MITTQSSPILPVVTSPSQSAAKANPPQTKIDRTDAKAILQRATDIAAMPEGASVLMWQGANLIVGLLADQTEADRAVQAAVIQGAARMANAIGRMMRDESFKPAQNPIGRTLETMRDTGFAFGALLSVARFDFPVTAPNTWWRLEEDATGKGQVYSADVCFLDNMLERLKGGHRLTEQEQRRVDAIAARARAVASGADPDVADVYGKYGASTLLDAISDIATVLAINA